MSQPGLLPSSQPAAGPSRRQDGLWKKAPAWRNLTVGAVLLTGVALSLPALLPQQQVPPPPVHHAIFAARIVAALPAPANVPKPVAVPAPRQVAVLQPAQHHSIAAPRPQTAPTENCSMTMPATPRQMSGTVVGYIPHEQSLNIFSNTEQHSGGIVNPAYIDDMRVSIAPDPGTAGGAHNPVVPAFLHVAVGDHVTYESPFRDPGQTCGYIPSHVTADQGQAPQVSASTQDAAVTPHD